MGCAPSAGVGNAGIRTGSASAAVFERLRHAATGLLPLPTRSASTGDLARTDSDADLLKIFRVFPPIHIGEQPLLLLYTSKASEIGSGVVPHRSDSSQTVIFVFGGPGSLKGILTQELSQEFDFITLSIEDLVFTCLPAKLAHTVGNTVEVQDAIRRNPSLVTLKWVLQMVSAKLATSTCQRFIVDIVPELTLLIQSAAFTSATHDEDLEEFERRHYVPFALELFIAQEYRLLEGGKSKENDESRARKEAERERLSVEMSSLLKSCDEADKGRLERRVESFHRCADPFIRYFRKTKRVVRMDLVVPNNEELFPAVSQLLMDFGVSRNNDAIRVVLFLANEGQADDLDLDWYGLRKMRLADVTHDNEETLTQQIRAVRKYIYRVARPSEHILVILKGLNNTDVQLMQFLKGTKRINFVESHSAYLDQYIRRPKHMVVSTNTSSGGNGNKPSTRSNRTVPASSSGRRLSAGNSAGTPSVQQQKAQSIAQMCRKRFRAITSTRGEICLFPESMSTRLCKKIGIVFGERLTLSETSDAQSGQQSRSVSRLSPSPAPPSADSPSSPLRSMKHDQQQQQLPPPSPFLMNGHHPHSNHSPSSSFSNFLAPPI